MVDPLTVFLLPLGKDLVLHLRGYIQEVANDRPTLGAGDWATQRLLLCHLFQDPESEDRQGDVDGLSGERHGEVNEGLMKREGGLYRGHRGRIRANDPVE
jgi:hypothetical protein